jgi:hypothetical protein
MPGAVNSGSPACMRDADEADADVRPNLKGMQPTTIWRVRQTLETACLAPAGEIRRAQATYAALSDERSRSASRDCSAIVWFRKKSAKSNVTPSSFATLSTTRKASNEFPPASIKGVVSLTDRPRASRQASAITAAEDPESKALNGR